MKLKLPTILVWIAGFVCGVVGVLTETVLLFYIGTALAVVGIILIHIKSKDKSVWQLIIDLLVWTP